MLNQFRTLAANFGAKLMLGLLILSFAIWGVGDMISPTGRNAPVATVGSAKISFDVFDRSYRGEIENLRRSLGDNYSPELVQNLRIPQKVLRGLINSTLLKLESKSLGLIPSDADIVRRIRSDPDFQDRKGNFDKAIFQAALRNNNLTEALYVEQLRQEIATGMLFDAFTGVTPVSEPAIKGLYDALEEQRAVTLYTLGPELVASIPQPDAAQLEAYYKERSSEFSAPEYRTVSYVNLTAENVPASATVSETDLKAAYEERIEEFRKPERRGVEQLLYSNEEKATKAHELLEGGKNVAQVAKETDILNKNALSLGKVERENIIDAAADMVFKLKKGEFTPPVKSPFGWHIFHVSAIMPPATLPFEEVRPALEKELELHSSENALNKFANHLEDALAGGSTLQEAAKEMKLRVHTIGPITREGRYKDGSEADLPALDRFLETAFKTDEKTESPLVTTKSGVYYIVRVDGVTPERVRPLEEVRAQVLSHWQKQERAKRLQSLMEDIVTQLASAETRKAAVEKYNLDAASPDPIKRTGHSIGGQPLPPGLAGDIFARRIGQGTDAHPAKNGHYLVAVVEEIIPAKGRQSDVMTGIRRGLSTATQNELVEQYMRYLADKYPISINTELLEAAFD